LKCHVISRKPVYHVFGHHSLVYNEERENDA
jgi:hypothetical protein